MVLGEVGGQEVTACVCFNTEGKKGVKKGEEEGRGGSGRSGVVLGEVGGQEVQEV